MRVAISADHAGLPLRPRVAEAVRAAGHDPLLLGPETAPPEGIDYPLVAKWVGDALAASEAERGIVICGSAAGVTVAANRLPGVRAAYAGDCYTAHQMVEHDHVNLLTLGARVMGPEVAAEIVATFLGATPSIADRHVRRLGEVLAFERQRGMNAAVRLHEVGQSLWLDNITRSLLRSGTLARYISSLAVTGLTSNPTILHKAVAGSTDYDVQFQALLNEGLEPEPLLSDLALDDLGRAAALFRPTWDATGGVDGWVSLEVPPRLAYDTASTVESAKALHAKAATPNLFIKIPGTPEGLPAIEETVAAGVPVNVTLLFSPEQYRAAAGAYLRGLERRLEAGLPPDVASVASLFVSRWDAAVGDQVGEALRNRLGVAVAKSTYAAYRSLLTSDRWQRLAECGARPQRLLWASTGTKDPALPDTYYIESLVSELTVNTMPESTLIAFGAHGRIGELLPADGGDAGETLARFEAAGIDLQALAGRLQAEGVKSFVSSWDGLLAVIASGASQPAVSG